MLSQRTPWNVARPTKDTPNYDERAVGIDRRRLDVDRANRTIRRSPVASAVAAVVLFVGLVYSTLGVVVVLLDGDRTAAYVAVAPGLAGVIGSLATFAWIANRNGKDGPPDPPAPAPVGIE